ncbi:MAG: hypothetical protein JW943_06865, partial [Deltaproteobacteria bacterium]|nr:hypothetical protein [Deltaproteobacteria bacterium]
MRMLNKLVSYVRARKIRGQVELMHGSDYEVKIKSEISAYKNVVNVADLPKIHGYWANNFVLPLIAPFGFINDKEFFQRYIQLAARHTGTRQCRVIALGSGNCELEVSLAEGFQALGIDNVTIECTDINPYMLDRARVLAADKCVA